MRELTLKELQDISLEILLDVHQFCVKNNIKYSLGYGTLLGAVRHQGWIPWDDDIDILMTRPEWEKFSRLYHSSKGYQLMTTQNPDSYMVYPRVYETARTISKSPAPYAKQQMGVWIDIFIVDGIPDDISYYNKKVFSKIKSLYNSSIYFRGMLALMDYKGWKGFIVRHFHPLIKSWIRICKKKIDLLCLKYQFNQSRFCACPHCPEALEKGCIRKWATKDFEEYIYIPFEGQQLMIADGYKNILQSIYGDYMKLPPKEERVRKHSSHKFYMIH